MAPPRLVMLGTLRRWGRLFDRLGVVRFCVVNVVRWTATLALGPGATMVTVDGANLQPTYLLLG